MKRTALVASSALALALACGTRDLQEPAGNSTNVILISIDTLRPDHLGSYGYERPTSPNLDAFRADSILFETAIAQAPSTLHSHASILSSLLPHHHRASWAAKTRLPEAAVSLPEVLSGIGYQTAAFTGGGQMDQVFGLDQGFESYEQPGEERFDGTVDYAIEWLKARDDRPFFLFLHSYEPHHPYAPEPEHLEPFDDDYEGPLPSEISVELLREINRDEVEIDDRDLAHIVATYDAEIRSMDEGFGRLVGYLRDRDLYAETLIVFTSDHGEEFGEHGKIGWHSHSLYDELLRVPLIVKMPANAHAGLTVEEQVRSLDIAPTILEVLGVARPTEFSGVALADRITEGSAASELMAVSRMDRRPERDISSVRTLRWKLYREQLFDLETDPAEQWDTAVNHAATVTELRQQKDRLVAAKRSLDEEQVVPDDATLEELRALGYLQ